MNAQKRLLLSYIAQMSGTGSLLVAATFVRRYAAAPMRLGIGGPVLLPLLALLQVALVWLLFLIVYRTYRRLDELQQLILLRTISAGAGAALCLVSSYMLLRPVFHLPDMSILYAPWFLGFCWVVIALGGSALAAMRGELHGR